MISKDQAKNITYVFTKLIDSELNGWETVDDYLELIEWLEDSQVIKEVDILFESHRYKKMGCPYKHPDGSICFVQNLIDAVESILELYDQTNELHPNNRYILDYYLALTQNGQIVELLDT